MSEMAIEERSTVPERRRVAVSWRGIFAGLLAGLVTQMVLTVLGLAIGLVALDGDGQDSLGGFSLGAAIWLALSLAISAYVAGRTAVGAARPMDQREGRFNGLLTGMLLLLVLTVFTVNVFFRSLNRVVGLAESVAGTAATAAGGLASADWGRALEALGLENEYQSLLSGFNEQELNQIITDAAPELNERQVAATTATVRAVMTRAGRNIGQNLSNISDLREVAGRQAEAAQQALTGPEFVARLRARGLSQAQAQEVERTVGQRVQEVRSEVQQTATVVSQRVNELSRSAAAAAGRAAWMWLLTAGLILGLATLAGGQGSHGTERAVPVVHRSRATLPGA